MPGTEAFSLEGRVAVVTGAASGIGRAAAVAFARAGARLILGDVDAEGLAQTAEMIGPGAIMVRTDVSQRDDVDRLAQQALSAFQRLDVWANVAGCLGNGAIIEVTEAEVDRVIAINQKGVFWGCAAAARAMMTRRQGSIINISSAGADSSPAGMSMYAMTKAAVNAFTRSLAREMGPFGIRANVISPGFVETPLAAWSYRGADGEIDAVKQEEALAIRRNASPLRLTGEPGDIALAMLYLASDASRFVTGENLRVNGGTSMF